MKALVIAVLSTVALVGCGVEPEEVDSTEQEVRRLTPCATVRCAAGTHCEAKGRRAYCVADKCTTDADCRLFDNYCDGCACDALLATSPNPFCAGTQVQCIRQPCGGLTAVCKAGVCGAATATAGAACGSKTCPSGEVCCNSSCGICTPPGGACIQIACAPAPTL
jgi:hypothetical protein